MLLWVKYVSKKGIDQVIIYFNGCTIYTKKCIAQSIGMPIYSPIDHLFNYLPVSSHCITEIAKDNQRSLRAHTKVGFKIADTSVFNGTEFYIVVWDWTS